MRNSILSFFFILGLNSLCYSQSKIATEFYNVDLPKGIEFREFNKTKEDYSNSDVYEFLQDGKPKYLLYLLSNKLNDDHAPVKLENVKNYVFDIGDINIEKVGNVNGKVRVVASSNEFKGLTSIIYVFQTGNILNRFLFLFPNEDSKSFFEEEVDLIVQNHIISKKTSW